MRNFIKVQQRTKNSIIILFLLIFSSLANAQWTQLGPGAGGQERAVYIYPNNVGRYDIYVGSDVSGVWRAPNVTLNDLNNPYAYQFEFISNHEIMRFVNKFYRYNIGNLPYIFCLNRSGIDRIEPNNQGAMITVPVKIGTVEQDFSNSWVSDMNIVNSTTYTYFVTGNTRVTDGGPGNFKESTINDIFCGDFNNTYDGVTLISSAKLYNLSANTIKRDAYCIYNDINGTTSKHWHFAINYFIYRYQW